MAGTCPCKRSRRYQPRCSGMVGIDLGVAIFAQLSDGTSYKPLHGGLSMARAQRKLMITRIHQKITRCRHDYLHKISRDQRKPSCHRRGGLGSNMVGRHGVMLSGEARHGLNKAILDQGWSDSGDMEYKRHGGVGWSLRRHRTTPVSNDTRDNRRSRLYSNCGLWLRQECRCGGSVKHISGGTRRVLARSGCRTL